MNDGKSRESDLWKRFAALATEAGCPKDQALNFSKAGWFPFKKQFQFAAACRQADRPDGPIEIGYGGARGGGKTDVLFAQIGLDDCQRQENLRALILRKGAKANLENFQARRMKIFGNIKHEFVPSKGLMNFPNGSRIIMGHFQNERDIDNYLGLEYDVIGIEESTMLTATKQRDISTCCRTSKNNWRPRMYSTTNPGGISHSHFKSKFILPFKAGRETTTRFIPSLVTDNPYVNPDYVRVLNELTGWKLRAWRDGDWDIAAGQFFNEFRWEKHVDPADKYTTAKAREWFMGYDYGYNHYTVFHLCFEDNDGNVVIWDEHAERKWIPERHAEAVKEMIGRHEFHFMPRGSMKMERRPLELRDIRRISAGPDVFSAQDDGRTIADDYAEHGINLELGHVNRINGWAEISKLLGDDKIAPRLFIHRRCKKLIDQLPQLVHDENKPEDVEKVDIDEDGNGGDDAADACRVALATKAFKAGTIRVAGL